jgi:hypothetical protein
MAHRIAAACAALSLCASISLHAGEDGALSALARKVLEAKSGGNFSGPVCTALGLSQNNEECFFYGVSSMEAAILHQVMVTQARGKTEIAFLYLLNGEAKVVLASEEGRLEKGVAASERRSEVSEIPASEASACLEREKAFWLRRLK